MDEQPPSSDMTDFISIIDGALEPDFCDELVARFEASERRAAGVTGQGGNKAHKDSVDLSITGLAEWRDLHQRLMDISLRHLLAYVREHKFMIAGAMALTLRD